MSDRTDKSAPRGRDPGELAVAVKQRESALAENAEEIRKLGKRVVGDLIEIAVERGKKARPDIKLGICGEHGGDPASIDFCEEAGLDYVSCSPYRVPIARLAAAQAALKRKG